MFEPVMNTSMRQHLIRRYMIYVTLVVRHHAIRAKKGIFKVALLTLT